MGGIVVITGTDTEIGKTFVGCALARALADAGVDVVAIKPVESGRSGEPSGEEDGVRLAQATGQEAPRCALQRLKAPLAPPDAADLEGADLDWEGWLSTIRGHARRHELVLVEGAGGLLSPLTWQKSALDLAVELGARAVVVAADRLGTQNHVLLTMRALQAEVVDVAAVVLSAPQRPDASTGRNAAALRRVMGRDRVVSLGRFAAWEDAAAELSPVARWILDGDDR